MDKIWIVVKTTESTGQFISVKAFISYDNALKYRDESREQYAGKDRRVELKHIRLHDSYLVV